MVGRIMNKVRNLWIMIISMLIFLGIVALILVLTSQSKTEIPKKGVFVSADLKTGGSLQ
ncbi:MAG: hypothetical protein QM315_07350 [Bacillota bacterium]|mgnify:CR=1 FL=1|jgi:hypothetical protein|nr:hypothetical protein [Bacillota bacterium]NLV63300.1 hypothetical protein [Clostridiaceae bacterium]